MSLITSIQLERAYSRIFRWDRTLRNSDTQIAQPETVVLRWAGPRPIRPDAPTRDAVCGSLYCRTPSDAKIALRREMQTMRASIISYL